MENLLYSALLLLIPVLWILALLDINRQKGKNTRIHSNWFWLALLFPFIGPVFYFLAGRRLDQPNFSHEFIEEIAFLIGNKKPESFKLLIDKLELD
jgi:hypothetical protein